MTIRFPVAPMLATAAERVPHGDGWAFEVKWDGYRTIAFVDDGHVRLQSRSGLDVTETYRAVADSVSDQTFATALVLDGELVVASESGRSDFGALQRGATPTFSVFDVLRIDDHDVVELDYLERRRLLGEVVEDGGLVGVPPNVVGAGTELFDSTKADGLEGIVAKRIDSTYQVGTRSTAWRKIKHRTTTTVTVGGYTVGSGARSATFGALLVGTAAGPDTPLRFMGGIGTGFDDATLVETRAVLDQFLVEQCPFDPPPDLPSGRQPRWVAPLLQMVVSMSDLTDDGHIRHGSFVGWHAPETG